MVNRTCVQSSLFISQSPICRLTFFFACFNFEFSCICWHGNQTKEREANVRRVIERKSLLPRMVYLSIKSASALLKENIGVNGSISDPKISSDLKSLLERYAKLLGFSLSDAIEVVVGVSGDQKHSSV